MQRTSPLLALYLITAALAGSASAETITVCAKGCDFTSINAAIAVASDGDLIQLAAETYFEGEVIDTLGKAITIQGTLDKSGEPASVIDGALTHQVIRCDQDESEDTQFIDLLIRNGNSVLGGGVYVRDAAPSFTNCILTNNHAVYGGGISLRGSHATLEDCVLAENWSDGDGGAAWCSGGSPSFIRCTVKYNNAGGFCGGIKSSAATGVTIHSCSICGNLDKSGLTRDSQVYPELENQEQAENCIRLICDDFDGIEDCAAIFSVCLEGCQFASPEKAVRDAEKGDTVEIAGGNYLLSGPLVPKADITIRGETDVNGEPTTILDGQGNTPVLVCYSVDAEIIKVENVRLINGNAEGTGGGCFAFALSIEFTNVFFQNNRALRGGGLYFEGAGIARLTSCTFSNNESYGSQSIDGGGGALFRGGLEGSPSARISGCVFDANTASYTAGGLGLNWCVDSEITNCIFSGNTASVTGGCALRGDRVSVIDSQFNGNSGFYSAVSHEGEDEPHSFINCRFTNNTARNGLAAFAGNNASVQDSIFCNNQPRHLWGPIEDQGGNCFTLNCEDLVDDCESIPCPTDLNDDGSTDGADLGTFFSQWGPCEKCSADLDLDGIVNGADLGILFLAWGLCP